MMNMMDYESLMVDLEWLKTNHPDRKTLIKFGERFQKYVNEHRGWRKEDDVWVKYRCEVTSHPDRTEPGPCPMCEEDKRSAWTVGTFAVLIAILSSVAFFFWRGN